MFHHSYCFTASTASQQVLFHHGHCFIEVIN
uniref:Uncharacterized protein n=1 Tax=Anguilla anguilla TaxID=7936 RepID=A0A0E9TCS2_ANGAN